MKKAILFVVLYLYSLAKRTFNKDRLPKNTLEASAMFLFYDSKRSDRAHSVVAFVLDAGQSGNNFGQELYGPFGPTSNIDLNGLHLYGRDTWGTVEDYQIDDPRNEGLRKLAEKFPDRPILLAGVRRLSGNLVYPLNEPSRFFLARKD